MKRYKIILLLGVCLFIIQSCEKEDIKIDKYDMKYIVKLSGDNKVSSIVLETYTYYPDENITAWMGDGKFRYEPYYIYDKDNYLFGEDSIIIKPDYKVYQGCTRYLNIRIGFNEYNDEEPKIIYREYYLGTDTINNGLDSRLVFIWPNDSAKYKYSEIKYDR